MNANGQTLTAETIISRYIELRDYIKARTDEFQKTGANKQDEELISDIRSACTEVMYSSGGFQHWADLFSSAATRLEQLLTPIKQYQEAMEILEAAAATMMKETGQSALKAESGTCFPVNKVSIKCLDKDAFHKFVREAQAWHFLTGNVVREAVESYMEISEGKVPPGLEVTGYTEIQFRKA